MKINEVESLIGMTKKNIRFYEEQGLITPNRNKDNGYRSYDDEDIKQLKQIMLFRKLDVPIEEIRSMQNGITTISDCMKRHLITLQRKQSNLHHAIEFCNTLKDSEILLSDFDAHNLLEEMNKMENKGTSFNNVKKKDIKTATYAGAIIATTIIIVFSLGMLFLFQWAFSVSPEEAPPLWFIIGLSLFFVACIVGAIISLVQRFSEIKKGEIEDAKKY
ncbi:MAG: MerR family transcriptional regulator [Firmicutes bacterium]|nr:MerR family transcriptional regulator [Bacillota bacterium]